MKRTSRRLLIVVILAVVTVCMIAIGAAGAEGGRKLKTSMPAPRRTRGTDIEGPGTAETCVECTWTMVKPGFAEDGYWYEYTMTIDDGSHPDGYTDTLYAPARTDSTSFSYTFYQPGVYWLYAEKYGAAEGGDCLDTLYQRITVTEGSGENALMNAVATAAAACEGENDFRTVEKINQYLCDLVEYDYSYTWYSPEAALLNGKSVCNGYSRSFELIAKACGLDCRRVGGTAGGDGHAWNLVKMDGDWYQMDVTWNDTTNENHLYFGLTDELIGHDHADMYIAGGETIVCDAMDDNWFIRSGEWDTRLARSTREQIQASISGGATEIEQSLDMIFVDATSDHYYDREDNDQFWLYGNILAYGYSRKIWDGPDGTELQGPFAYDFDRSVLTATLSEYVKPVEVDCGKMEWTMYLGIPEVTGPETGTRADNTMIQVRIPEDEWDASADAPKWSVTNNRTSTTGANYEFTFEAEPGGDTGRGIRLKPVADMSKQTAVGDNTYTIKGAYKGKVYVFTETVHFTDGAPYPTGATMTVAPYDWDTKTIGTAAAVTDGKIRFVKGQAYVLTMNFADNAPESSMTPYMNWYGTNPNEGTEQALYAPSRFDSQFAGQNGQSVFGNNQCVFRADETGTYGFSASLSIGMSNLTTSEDYTLIISEESGSEPEGDLPMTIDETEDGQYWVNTHVVIRIDATDARELILDISDAEGKTVAGFHVPYVANENENYEDCSYDWNSDIAWGERHEHVWYYFHPEQEGEYTIHATACYWEGTATPTDLDIGKKEATTTIRIDKMGDIGMPTVGLEDGRVFRRGEMIEIPVTGGTNCEETLITVYDPTGMPFDGGLVEDGEPYVQPTWGLSAGEYTVLVQSVALKYVGARKTVHFTISEDGWEEPTEPVWTLRTATGRNTVETGEPFDVAVYIPNGESCHFYLQRDGETLFTKTGRGETVFARKITINSSGNVDLHIDGTYSDGSWSDNILDIENFMTVEPSFDFTETYNYYFGIGQGEYQNGELYGVDSIGGYKGPGLAPDGSGDTSQAEWNCVHESGPDCFKLADQGTDGMFKTLIPNGKQMTDGTTDVYYVQWVKGAASQMTKVTLNIKDGTALPEEMKASYAEYDKTSHRTVGEWKPLGTELATEPGKTYRIRCEADEEMPENLAGYYFLDDVYPNKDEAERMQIITRWPADDPDAATLGDNEALITIPAEGAYGIRVGIGFGGTNLACNWMTEITSRVAGEMDGPEEATWYMGLEPYPGTGSGAFSNPKAFVFTAPDLIYGHSVMWECRCLSGSDCFEIQKSTDYYAEAFLVPKADLTAGTAVYKVTASDGKNIYAKTVTVHIADGTQLPEGFRLKKAAYEPAANSYGEWTDVSGLMEVEPEKYCVLMAVDGDGEPLDVLQNAVLAWKMPGNDSCLECKYLNEDGKTSYQTTNKFRVYGKNQGADSFALVLDVSGTNVRYCVETTIAVTVPGFQFRLPGGTVTIEEEAFAGIAAASVWIPDGCATIGDGAFAGSGVKKIRIPASVRSVGENAFPAGTIVYMPEAEKDNEDPAALAATLRQQYTVIETADAEEQ